MQRIHLPLSVVNKPLKAFNLPYILAFRLDGIYHLLKLLQDDTLYILENGRTRNDKLKEKEGNFKVILGFQLEQLV